MHLLKRFLTLPVIIGPLPNQILAGQLISALPVMQNFQWIVDQVNSNLAALTPTNSSSIPTYVGVGFVGGTANAITLTPSPAISAYTAGQRFSFLATAPNTSAVTINTSGLGTRALVYADATALSGSEILGGSIYDIEDNGTNYTLMNSSQGSAIITWTPVLSFGGGTTGITYTRQQGKAWKFGRMIYVAFHIILSSKGSSTGGVLVSGLPFTVNAGWAGNMPGPVYAGSVSFPSGYLIFYYLLGTTTIGMANVATGSAPIPMLDSAFTNTSEIAGSGFYVI